MAETKRVKYTRTSFFKIVGVFAKAMIKLESYLDACNEELIVINNAKLGLASKEHEVNRERERTEIFLTNLKAMMEEKS